MGEGKRIAMSNEQRAMSNEAVGNGFQPFRRAALRQAQGDLPLPPPEGDTRDEVVGRGPRARRFSDCSGIT